MPVPVSIACPVRRVSRLGLTTHPPLAILADMEQELDYLEGRVGALIARIHELENQNGRFAEVLAQTMKENAEMKFALEETRNRVVALMHRLPPEDNAE